MWLDAIPKLCFVGVLKQVVVFMVGNIRNVYSGRENSTENDKA